MLLVLLGVYAWTDACAAVAAEGLALRFIALFTHPISPLLPHPNPRPALQYTLRRRRCPAAPSPSWRCSPLSWRPSCWCLAPSTSCTQSGLGGREGERGRRAGSVQFVRDRVGDLKCAEGQQECSEERARVRSPLHSPLILPPSGVSVCVCVCCSWPMFDAAITLPSLSPEPTRLPLLPRLPCPCCVCCCSWHMFDAVIVLVSFTLELSLRGVAQEVASLLIFFR